MRASAHLAVAWTERTARTRITRLHSDAPLVLRPTIAVGPDPFPCWDLPSARPARVSIAAGAAGPLGGDDLRLEIDVQASAALVLRNVAATLVLPGPRGQLSRTEITVRVAANATLVWLAGPVIAARNCDHQAITRVELESGARLFLREELLLGRHDEQPGAIRQRLRVCLDSHPLHDQEIAVGPGAAGWASTAVTGGRRALGAALIVAPEWGCDRVTLPPPVLGADVALLPLSGTAALITALAPDGLALRRRLDAGLAAADAALRRVDPVFTAP